MEYQYDTMRPRLSWLWNTGMLEGIAGVVEWYTRTTQNRMPQGLRVQVPPPAHEVAGRMCLRTSVVGLEDREYVSKRSAHMSGV
jgi:hypothetical protein